MNKYIITLFITTTITVAFLPALGMVEKYKKPNTTAAYARQCVTASTIADHSELFLKAKSCKYAPKITVLEIVKNDTHTVSYNYNNKKSSQSEYPSIPKETASSAELCWLLKDFNK